MEKKISEIYTEYKIMPNLQEHMLRVAAVATLICDNFTEPVDKDEILTASLLHDMGNIIKFKLDSLPQFLEPGGLEYWQSVKDEFIKKYGNNEHEATAMIIDELGLPNRVAILAGQNQFSSICKHRDADNMSMKILHYSDGRVSPYGVVSYDDRMNEAKKRYANHKEFFNEEKRSGLVACGKEIEKQIFSKCKIKPEDINDESVKTIILFMRDFVIK